MAQQITIDITPAGTVKVEANGFQGKSCAAATEQIELVLGGAEAKKRKEKPEYYAPPVSSRQGNKLTTF